MSTTEQPNSTDAETELREWSVLLFADLDQASDTPPEAETATTGNVVPTEGTSPSTSDDPDNLRAFSRDLFNPTN